MLVTYNNSWNNHSRKRTVKKDFKVGPNSVKFITIALIAIAALFYLSQSAQGSSQKYQIMQLTQQRQDLEARTKDLEVEAARLKSLDEIKKSTQANSLVPIDDNNFIKGTTN